MASEPTDVAVPAITSYWLTAPSGFGLEEPKAAGRPPVWIGTPSTAAPNSGVYVSLWRKVSTKSWSRGSVGVSTWSWYPQELMTIGEGSLSSDQGLRSM